MSALAAALLAACIVCGALADSVGDTVFMTFVHRHGDRSPIYNAGPALSGAKRAERDAMWRSFGGHGQLTSTGARQLEQLGAAFRARYAAALNVESYSPQAYYVRSTDYDRTLGSATAFLKGFFPRRAATGPDAVLPPVPIQLLGRLRSRLRTRARPGEKVLRRA